MQKSWSWVNTSQVRGRSPILILSTLHKMRKKYCAESLSTSLYTRDNISFHFTYMILMTMIWSTTNKIRWKKYPCKSFTIFLRQYHIIISVDLVEWVWLVDRWANYAFRHPPFLHNQLITWQQLSHHHSILLVSFPENLVIQLCRHVLRRRNNFLYSCCNTAKMKCT